MESEPTPADGQDQWAAITQARAALADRLVTPWWYHPILGLLLGGMVAAIGLGSAAVWDVATVVLLLGIVGLASAYRQLTGVWVADVPRGRPRRWLVAAIVVVVGPALACLDLGLRTTLSWPQWVLAAITFVGVIVSGRGYDAALRARLRSDA